ncbi:MAG: HPr kinase/phosphorylase [Rhodocyclales bacterium]|jgi:Hpr(Ser) kinase/phosphatase (EC 2.7.1.-)|nr:HPr(Ser) kinase/phosphatase [Rhodocyclaceae bacterium]PWB42247.1 MAG: HPr kinase/phosphorylase [Rhodocyclales bacterium]GIK26580.1 MAG: HPr kinase/phosphorylase [Betaproteobacteria bacterium]
MRQASVAQLFEYHRERLQLLRVSGNLDAPITINHAHSSPADLVGHLNLIHPDRIQVIGAPEINWATKQHAVRVSRHMEEIIAAHPPAVIVADGCAIPASVREACEKSDTALFSTPHSAAVVIDLLRLWLSRQLAETVELHAVMMDVLGMGVLITGDSGVGKSELALELISRGHGLVADDIVEIARVSPNTLEARCPPMLKDFLEVRGLGVLNIRTVFGETACRRKMKLKLIVNLLRPQKGAVEIDRLPLGAETHEILGVPVRKVSIPVAAGRNLAVLLEAAVRSTILLLRGIDSTQEFVERHKQAMDEGDGTAG